MCFRVSGCQVAHSSRPCWLVSDFAANCMCVAVLPLQAAEAAVMGLSVSPGELKTETVEEFISISDGQVRPGCNCAALS